MKKLLLLLPLMALASCSGGHDLMSKRTFKMTCPHIDDWTFTIVINPELPQATLRIEDGKPRMLDLIGVSPTQFRLSEERISYTEIDRETEAVTVDGYPVEGCTFKSL